MLCVSLVVLLIQVKIQNTTICSTTFYIVIYLCVLHSFIAVCNAQRLSIISLFTSSLVRRTFNLVPSGCDPFGQHQGYEPLVESKKRPSLIGW